MRKAVDMQTKTVSTTVIRIKDFGFDPEYLAKATGAIVSTRLAGIMVSWTGKDPTTTDGHPLMTNLILPVLGIDNVQNLGFVREGAVDAEVTITLETGV